MKRAVGFTLLVATALFTQARCTPARQAAAENEAEKITLCVLEHLYEPPEIILVDCVGATLSDIERVRVAKSKLDARLSASNGADAATDAKEAP